MKTGFIKKIKDGGQLDVEVDQLVNTSGQQRQGDKLSAYTK